MILFENTKVTGLEATIRSIRSPMNSVERSDSKFCKTPDDQCCDGFVVGPKDHKLMMTQATNHRNIITVYTEIEAPIYWWGDFEASYKNGVVIGPYSIVEKILKRPLRLFDFSVESLDQETKIYSSLAKNPDNNGAFLETSWNSYDVMMAVTGAINRWRRAFINTSDSDKRDYCWKQILQLLPASFLQKRTLVVNYDILSQIYARERDSKMSEWGDFCDWIETLPYSELILTKEDRKETEE